jgi:hypothetical protein
MARGGMAETLSSAESEGTAENVLKRKIYETKLHGNKNVNEK